MIQVGFFALVMGLLGLIFFYIGISMGWLYVSTVHHQTSRLANIANIVSLGIHGSRSWISCCTYRACYFLA